MRWGNNTRKVLVYLIFCTDLSTFCSFLVQMHVQQVISYIIQYMPSFKYRCILCLILLSIGNPIISWLTYQLSHAQFTLLSLCLAQLKWISWYSKDLLPLTCYIIYHILIHTFVNVSHPTGSVHHVKSFHLRRSAHHLGSLSISDEYPSDVSHRSDEEAKGPSPTRGPTSHRGTH